MHLEKGSISGEAPEQKRGMSHRESPQRETRVGRTNSNSGTPARMRWERRGRERERERENGITTEWTIEAHVQL